METETTTATIPPYWRDRWLSWCPRCAAETDPDSSTCTHCGVCGDRYPDSTN